MRQCERCKFYVPDDAQFCPNCGNSLIVSPTVTSTIPSQTPGRPPEPPRRQRYTYFIPGLGACGLLRRDSVTKPWGCAPGCLITSILIALLSLSGFLFLRLHNPPTAYAQASLSVDHAVPGGTMHVHGSNFPPGSSVKITVDENSAASYTLILLSIGGSTLQKKLLRLTDTIVTVQNDGTFDATIPVPTTWTPGSHHIIRATAQNVQTSAQASSDVEIESPGQTATVPSTVTPTATPTPTPIPALPSQSPPPTISSLDPSSGPASGGTTVIINGSGFTGATGVSFGSTAAANVNVVSDKQITAVSPVGSGTVDVTVTTPKETSKTSGADHFNYVVPAPVVKRISITSGTTKGGNKVVITGTGFTKASSVAFGVATVICGSGSKCTVDSDTQITVVSPAKDPSDTSNFVDVTVTTPGGTSATSGVDRFTYLPEVDSISPAKGPEAGGTTVTIIGFGFTNASKVAFGSAIVDCSDGHSCTINSDGTQITVNSPHEALSDESQDHVYVTVTDTGGGTSSTNDANKFIYTL
jgi:IPT/TIG domain